MIPAYGEHVWGPRGSQAKPSYVCLSIGILSALDGHRLMTAHFIFFSLFSFISFLSLYRRLAVTAKGTHLIVNIFWEQVEAPFIRVTNSMSIHVMTIPAALASIETYTLTNLVLLNKSQLMNRSSHIRSNPLDQGFKLAHEFSIRLDPINCWSTYNPTQLMNC